MDASGIGSITCHLLDSRAGDGSALARLTGQVHAELSPPTGLGRELCFSLLEPHPIDWQGRAHFLNRVLPRILIGRNGHIASTRTGERGWPFAKA